MTTTTFKKLNIEYGKLCASFRKAIEKEVKVIMGKRGKQIRFKETVFVHLIDDNHYLDCRSIERDNDWNLTFHCERNSDGVKDDFDEFLDDGLDCASFYELLLALDEKDFVIEDENGVVLK